MDEVIEESLIQAGWFEGRTIETSNIELKLREKEYDIFELGKNFIKEYGLLKISFTNPRLPKLVNVIDIDPIITIGGISKSVVEAYENHCGESMIPLAEIQQQCMTICITPRGWFYGGYDDWLLKLGENFEESLFNLITCVRIEPIMVELSD